MGTVVVALALGALGVSIGAAASGESVQQFLTDAYNNCKADVDANLERIHDGAIRLTEPVLKSVGSYWNDYYKTLQTVSYWDNTFPHGYVFSNPKIDQQFMRNAFNSPDYYNTAGTSDIGYGLKSLTFIATFTWGQLANQKYIELSSGAKVLIPTYSTSSDGVTAQFKFPNSDGSYISQYATVQFYWHDLDKFVVPTDHQFWILCQYVDRTGKSGYSVLTPQYSGQSSYVQLTDSLSTGIPAVLPQPLIPYKEFVINGHSVQVNGVDDTVNAIKQKVGVVDTDGTTVIPVTNTGAPDKVDERNTTQTQSQTIGKDIATDADKAANDAANQGHDTSVPKPQMPDLALPTLITKKFPFSIPWDLYGAVKGLAATPIPPKFVYPIKLQRLGIDQSITIDFAPYDTLAAISRWGIGAAFLIWLIINTRKLIGGGD